MENKTEELHVQKVAILSRLVKESSLTLEEALFLLKEEEKELVTVGTSGYGTITTNYPPLGTWGTSSSTGTYVVPLSFLSMSGTTTSTNITNTAEESADLNN